MKKTDLCLIVIILILLFFIFNTNIEKFQDDSGPIQSDPTLEQPSNKSPENAYTESDTSASGIGSQKCEFEAIGATPYKCINNCINSMGAHPNCNPNKCVDVCENCVDTNNCNWLKDQISYQILDKSNQNKCSFKPYGINKKECVTECMDACEYGLDCSKEVCNEKCRRLMGR